MILIADAGATSIDWRIIQKNGEVKQAKSKGYNAYQQSESYLVDSIQEAKAQFQEDGFDSVYFYGAGVSSDENKEKTIRALKQGISANVYNVEHDLLAAARASFTEGEGIACILGTGTNSCYYNGEQIEEVIPSLGFALGDEGSGASLGRRLVKSYLRKDIPKDLSELFERRFEISEKLVLTNIYKGETPSQYLSSFAKFCFHHKRHPYIYQLIYTEFKSFLKKY